MNSASFSVDGKYVLATAKNDTRSLLPRFLSKRDRAYNTVMSPGLTHFGLAVNCPRVFNHTCLVIGGKLMHVGSGVVKLCPRSPRY